MGVVASIVLPIAAAVTAVATLCTRLISGNRDRNPTMVAIEQKLEEERRARENAERSAKEAAQKAAADRRARENAERSAKESAQKAAADRRARENVERSAKEAAQKTAADRQARENAERSAKEAAQKAATEREQAARAREAASRAEKNAQEAAARAQREKAEADAARAAQHEAQRQAEASRRAEAEATERAQREKAAKEQAEQDSARTAQELEDARQKWREGIEPVEWPTAEQYHNTLEARQYKEGFFHFAVAGIAGCGKSSLINALRGVSNGSKTAAAVGITETTLDITRYPDPRRDHPFVWYDIPGAGTLHIPRWEYFNKQGLFIFDCIIVLWDSRLTDTDIAILDNCARYKIPCFIVRSKSDVHLRNMERDTRTLIEEDEDIDEDERERQLESVPSEVLVKYCEESRKSVESNLHNAKLPAQKVYLVNNETLKKTIQGKLRVTDQANIIDEVNLIHDILATAHERRNVPREMPSKND